MTHPCIDLRWRIFVHWFYYWWKHQEGSSLGCEILLTILNCSDSFYFCSPPIWQHQVLKCEGLCPAQNSYVEILTPKVMVSGGIWGRLLSHKGGNLMKGTVLFLIKEALESLLPASPDEYTREVSSLQPRRGPPSEPHHAGTLILDIQPSEM